MTIRSVLPRLEISSSAASVPAAILLASLAGFVIAALATGSAGQISASGLIGLMERTTALGIVALGQTVAVLVRSVDLSVASVISVAAVLASWIMQGRPEMMLPGCVAVLGIAAVVGAVNGLLVTRLRVNPLIATLGTGLALQGALSASFTNFAGSVPKSFQGFAYGTIAGLPVSVLLFLGLALLLFLVLSGTRFGAHVYAAGGNPEGARLAGIKTDRVVLQAHVLCSLSAGLTGLYLASRLGSGAPWVGRDGVYDLESIAVVVVGGTLLAGGKGGVWGTVAAVILFACLDAVFNMVGVDAFVKQVLRGAIVIIAVAAYSFRFTGHVA